MDNDGESLSSVNSSRREEVRSTEPQENDDDDDEIEQQHRDLLKKRNNKQIQKQLKKLPMPHVQKNTRSPFLGAFTALSDRETRLWNPTQKSKPFAHVCKHCKMLMNTSWKCKCEQEGHANRGKLPDFSKPKTIFRQQTQCPRRISYERTHRERQESFSHEQRKTSKRALSTAGEAVIAEEIMSSMKKPKIEPTNELKEQLQTKLKAVSYHDTALSSQAS